MNLAARLRLGRPMMDESHYVYIPGSEQDGGRHYTGHTTDLAERVAKHNKGDVSHTAKFRPWRLETAVAFRSAVKAIAFEKYLKSGSGREFARRHF